MSETTPIVTRTREASASLVTMLTTAPARTQRETNAYLVAAACDVAQSASPIIATPSPAPKIRRACPMRSAPSPHEPRLETICVTIGSVIVAESARLTAST
jgi:hypothetical protein